jgi:hypothetical protein
LLQNIISRMRCLPMASTAVVQAQDFGNFQ